MENHFWNHWTGKINVAVPLRRCVKAWFATIPLNYYGKAPTVIECVAIKWISLFRAEFCVNNICWQLKVKNAENVIFDSKENICCVLEYISAPQSSQEQWAISWKYPNTQLNSWLWTRMFMASMKSIGIFIVYQTGNLIELHMSSYRKNNINHSKTSLINKERYRWKRRILRNENANMNWNLLREEKKKEYKDDTRKCEWVR